jgi:hypothetical protein
MPFKQINGVKIFYFESLDLPRITHGIVTRRGGVSPSPWASLNVGASVGDSPELVEKNIEKIFTAFEVDPDSKYDVWQIHSSTVQIAEYPRGAAPPVQADIILTNRPDITLLMRFADCVPIFLYDPVSQVIALVHAGREGLAKRAPGIAVESLVETFGVDPHNVIAGIGPSICPECYEVGEEVYQTYLDTLGKKASAEIFNLIGGNYHLDLWSCAQSQLQDAGVSQIELSEICTATNLDDWYSHRGEMGKTGRFAGIISLNG